MSFVDSFLGQGGSLSRRLSNFTYRPQQVQVAQAIAESLAEEKLCLAEAGTGVGKTMAYLVPALEQIRQGKKVVISTHTLNLQGQLVSKDIPLLKELAGEPGFEAVQVKGMGNYLCRFNLDFEQSLPVAGREESLKKIIEWSRITQSGDFSELSFSIRGAGDLGCESDSCQRKECRYYDDCFYYDMRRAAAEADLLIVNHALFFADLEIRLNEPNAAILPNYDVAIFDEAQHLEAVASRVFGIEFSNYRIPQFLSRVKRLRTVAADQRRLDAIGVFNGEMFDLFERVRRQEFFLDEALGRDGITALHSAASQLLLLLKEQHGDLMAQAREVAESDAALHDRLEGFARIAGRIAGDLDALLFHQDEHEWFSWGERPSQQARLVRTTLHRTPLKVAEMLQERFWPNLKGGALVSATLSNSGGFSYLKSRLGIQDARSLVVGSPFNFRNNCLLYVPVHLDFPSDSPEYIRQIASEMGQIVSYSQGRAFLLFTSYRMLDRVYDLLSSELEFPLLKQGEMPNHALLEEFRKLPNACLFGTASFWEGVDVQGEKLSCVIIDKLPFSVPDTPVARARIKAVEEAGGNSFTELSVPEAQIRLKQGFGRLIRTSSDRGVVAIFDSRLIKKYYGRAFLSVLPPAKLSRSLEEVAQFYRSASQQRSFDPAA